MRHDAVAARRTEAERACHAIAATRREETERRETQGWRDAPDGAELFAEGSDARNELKRLEAWLQTTDFRVKVDDERWRRGVRDGAFDRGAARRWRRGGSGTKRVDAPVGRPRKRPQKTQVALPDARRAARFVITREALRRGHHVRRAKNFGALRRRRIHQRTVR